MDHLKSNCNVISKFTKIVISLTVKEDFFLKTATKDIGKLTNKISKTKIPNIETGSYIKFLKRLSSNISRNLSSFNIQRQTNNNLNRCYMSKCLIIKF